jgi:formamidopyrimidine-DNA glycosylase
MLAGRFQLQRPGDKAVAKICFSLVLDNGQILHYADAKRMGKVYLTWPGETEQIPGFNDQGVDVLGPAFTLELFRSLIETKRNQVRVFVMDQTLLSAIGNAYADEILFAAGLHPKTLCSQLSPEDIERLYRSIVRVLAWGIDEVRRADQPLEAKVRGHVKVRNRKGEPCPVCGTTIRRAGVLGYDVFFCPRCQPPRRRQTIPWEKTP